jgi:acetyl-CoA C-acetyltransferase
MAKRGGLPGSGRAYEGIHLVDGVRTAFGELNGALSSVSATDLGIAAAKALFARAPVAADDIDSVLASSLAPSDFDAYYLPRHIALYSGVPEPAPATFVHRLCGSGFELLIHAADYITLDKASAVLCVGAEAMSRNPVAAFSHRGGFRLGQVEFKDYLWESLSDPCPDLPMGRTAENLAIRYQISRDEVDDYAARSFEAAGRAQAEGWLAGEIAPVEAAEFGFDGYKPRRLRLPRGVKRVDADEHLRPTPRDTLGRLPAVFGGVQTAGNSSGIVDGAALVLIGNEKAGKANGLTPRARVVATATSGADPTIMLVGPTPATLKVLDRAGLTVDDIDIFELNEAFASVVLKFQKDLHIPDEKLNVNGGAIAMGHPLGATGAMITGTMVDELERRGAKRALITLCIGGGMGVATIIERV